MKTTSTPAPGVESISINRRKLLTAAAIAPAIAAVPAMAVAASRGDTSQWNAAYAAFRRTERRYDELCKHEDDANNAVADAQPRVDRYFDEYGLNTAMAREQIESHLRFHAVATGKSIDVDKETEAFAAYLAEGKALKARYRVDELGKARKAYYPTFLAARDALMRVPAPTTATLLAKMEIAAISLDDEHAEATLADARRLLGEA